MPGYTPSPANTPEVESPYSGLELPFDPKALHSASKVVHERNVSVLESDLATAEPLQRSNSLPSYFSPKYRHSGAPAGPAAASTTKGDESPTVSDDGKTEQRREQEIANALTWLKQHPLTRT
ncbi:hypothetical protein MNV49_002814 [Pseudohyphozyma bogoriensis]|nr:hypothetical protein MNV49_002814 [Pseudohyphozyma bogoriensis]